eukprot:gene10886-12685_t
MLFTRDVEVAKHVLNSDPTAYEKPPDSSGVLIRLARAGILMAEGDEWRHQRDLLAAPFSPSNVRKMESVINQSTQNMVNRIIGQSSSTGNLRIEAHHTMTSLTYEIIGLLSIGRAMGDSSSFHFILDEMIRPIRRLSRYIPLPSDLKLNRLIKDLENSILKEIDHRRSITSTTSRQSDLLDALLNTNQSISDDQIELLEWIILETLRLFPPAPMVGRTAQQDDQLPNGWMLPKKK